MKGAGWLFLSLIISMTNQQTAQSAAVLAHVSNSFHFVIRAPLSRAAPLFGPEGERCWAGQHWNPQFLYPQPGKDIEGAVFTVQRGAETSVWVNTLFDPEGGRMQYVSFVPGIHVFTVDVRLTPLDSSSTSVEVTYVRTALDMGANDDVEAMGKSDRESGPHWQHEIESCLTAQH
jgi:hypothetical protein